MINPFRNRSLSGRSVRKRNPGKHNAGFTLTELIVAAAILSIITFSVLGLYSAAIKMNAVSRATTLYAYETELKLEELQGLTKGEFVKLITNGGEYERVVTGGKVTYKYDGEKYYGQLPNNTVGLEGFGFYLRVGDPDPAAAGAIPYTFDSTDGSFIPSKGVRDYFTGAGTYTEAQAKANVMNSGLIDVTLYLYTRAAVAANKVPTGEATEDELKEAIYKLSTTINIGDQAAPVPTP